jgi:hypothetical protein
MSFADKAVAVPSKKLVAVGPGQAAITRTPFVLQSFAEVKDESFGRRVGSHVGKRLNGGIG